MPIDTRLHLPLLGGIALAALVAPARAEREAEVKAAYLFNFARFVEWPASAFAASSTFIIGLAGRDDLAEELSRALAGQKVSGRPVEIRSIAAGDSSALRACHLVYVSAAESGRVESVAGAVSGRPVLLVGDPEDFAGRGGAIGFVREGGTVKFEINPRAAARQGLAISARLLRVAQNVR